MYLLLNELANLESDSKFANPFKYEVNRTFCGTKCPAGNTDLQVVILKFFGGQTWHGCRCLQLSAARHVAGECVATSGLVCLK